MKTRRVSKRKSFEQLRMHHDFGFCYEFYELQRNDLLNCTVNLKKSMPTKLSIGICKWDMLAEELY